MTYFWKLKSGIIYSFESVFGICLKWKQLNSHTCFCIQSWERFWLKLVKKICPHTHICVWLEEESKDLSYPWKGHLLTSLTTTLLACLLAKSLQSCPTLCDPIDGSPPGSPVPGILQARTLEWVAISFSNAWKWEVKVKSLSRVRLLATPWTAAHQAHPSMGFSRQEYWSGVPLPSPKCLLVMIFD